MTNASPIPRFERIALIGIGLIGSSLARVVRRDGLCPHIAVCARTHATLEKAETLGIADSTTTDPRDAADGADLVVLCTPLGSYGEIARAIAPVLRPGAIVTDVGSAKECVIADVGPYLPEGVHFVPAHPIAGTEHSGPEAGFAELFLGRYCILTPPPGTDEAAVERVAALWRQAGMTVEVMSARHHDRVLAITSHLPHLIAYTIVGTATDLADEAKSEVIKFSAGGFRDFTRIAASDPVMWRDVFLNNRDAVLEMLARFTEDLTALQRAIRWGEGEILQDRFTRTREIRRGIVEAKQA
jgi:cyclohexadieny/prephenate dehydrogenase